VWKKERDKMIERISIRAQDLACKTSEDMVAAEQVEVVAGSVADDGAESALSVHQLFLLRACDGRLPTLLLPHDMSSPGKDS